MAIPLLEYSPASQNQRVEGYVVPGDDQPKVYSTDNILSGTEMDNLIEAAYRQMFFYAFKWDREVALESQLRTGQITVRDFIRGLMLSKTFRDSFYEKNSNYRFVEQCIQRVLGRDPYNEQEKIAWSIVIATKGLQGFADALLNSEEYINNFGYNTVPYQRRRVLPSREEGERPINIKSPRYDAYFRAKLGFPQPIWQTQVRRFRPQEKQAREGDPSQFLSMAQSIRPRSNTPQQLSAMNVDYQKAVPYRKLS
ncbi:MAG: phycobilisome rod-core linker polypeptide CpcG [Leptolyngbya sp. SIO4C5]|uniref:phycobilisome rod-core linker polypeptide n=1 Tax=Sphaerothrix gracilis TaxID=3151835 RepID=UPI0013BFBD96|nr:phycobilisome rod-core linker polypeptide CpcG [Leptolyngbya sp. SIO4C5]